MRKQKEFYYKAGERTEIYRRIGKWAKIDYTTPRDPEKESRPFFRHGNGRQYIDNFIRCGSAWLEPLTIEAADGEKIDLAGMEQENYYKPLFIELDEAGERARVYQFIGNLEE
jgi:hypothetical protein